jgi:hypothetical protein
VSAPGGPVPASILCFQHVYAAATQGYRSGNREPPISPELPDSIHVDACKHVNALFFTVAGCRCLIPLTFPHGYRAVSLQQPFGGDVSPYCRRFSGVKANPAKIPAGDFNFLDFLSLCDRPRRPSHMEHATLWVNVAQLIVAIIALAVSIVTLRRK